jgi:hypothetical protein
MRLCRTSVKLTPARRCILHDVKAGMFSRSPCFVHAGMVIALRMFAAGCTGPPAPVPMEAMQ